MNNLTQFHSMKLVCSNFLFSFYLLKVFFLFFFFLSPQVKIDYSMPFLLFIYLCFAFFQYQCNLLNPGDKIKHFSHLLNAKNSRGRRERHLRKPNPGKGQKLIRILQRGIIPLFYSPRNGNDFFFFWYY